MSVCRRNGKIIAWMAGFISDKGYYADVPVPMPLDFTGNGERSRADEQRKYFLEGGQVDEKKSKADS